jgi:hypothetical protein
MDFEINILKGIKKDYEQYIIDNNKTYKNTLTYIKYIEYKQKSIKKIKSISEQIDIFKGIEKNYKNKMVNYQIQDFMLQQMEKVRNLEEELKFIDLQIFSLNYDLIIYKMVENYKNEIHRLEKRISELEIKLNSEYEIVEI